MATMERLRTALAEIEEIDRIIVAELDTSAKKAKTQRDQIESDQRIATFIKAERERAQLCRDTYQDKDGIKKAEIEAMSDQSQNLEQFYEELHSLRAYHRQFAAVSPGGLKEKLEKRASAVGLQTAFSGEESHGRYLDLNSFYQRFVNLAGDKASKQGDSDGKSGAASALLDYRSYLDVFADFRKQKLAAKKGAAFVQYLRDLKAYLESFYRRCHPLADDDELQEKLQKELQKFLSGDAMKADPGYVDLSKHSSTKSLEALGLDALKAGLQVIGWKCGGTLADRAARLFAAKGLSPQRLITHPNSSTAGVGPKTGKKRKRRRGRGGAKKKQAVGEVTPSTETPTDASEDDASVQARKEVAELEFSIGFYAQLLSNTLKNTKRFVETRQIRTYEELVAEKAAQDEAEALMAAEDDEDSDDEEKPTYNPLNLPLGWDGKPIPFWLYKLHGLGVEFKCEICGDFSYWGRRDFDRHFQESRHAYGMRCLGIPNTKHFHDITLIADAQALHAKLMASAQKDTWNAEEEEEFEDSEGNVFDKKTYQDLAKQGLL